MLPLLLAIFLESEIWTAWRSLSEISFEKPLKSIYGGEALRRTAQRGARAYLLPGLIAGMPARSGGRLSGSKVSTFI
jgi:hypothetical protein